MILKYCYREKYYGHYALASDLFEERLIMYTSKSWFKRIFCRGALKSGCKVLVVDKKDVYDYFCNRYFSVIYVPYIAISTIKDMNNWVENNIDELKDIDGAWINTTQLKDYDDTAIINFVNETLGPNKTVLIKCKTCRQASTIYSQRECFNDILINKQRNCLIKTK